MSIAELPPVLDGLPTVDLGEVTAVADLQTRRDRKYLLDRAALPDLLERWAPSTRVLAIDGVRSFGYGSTYFDTPDLVSYLQAARRRPSRFKVRTRTYRDAGQCVLEVKLRDGRGRTVKHRHPHRLDGCHELTDDGRRFLAGFERIGPVADRLVPTLTTEYRRTTLLLADGSGRVTVDLDLACAEPGGASLSLPDVVLVETKTGGAPCEVDRSLWRSGHRPVGVSKYGTSLATLRPDLPSNKWHRVIQRSFGPVHRSGHAT